MNARLIVNPAAGNTSSRSIGQIEYILEKEVSLTTYVTQKRGDAFRCAQTLKEVDRLIVAGGDGTINEVLNGLLNAEDPQNAAIPVAIIPAGTANVLAAELNIPANIEKAAELALKGSPRKICLGRINGRYFSLMAGIGLDAEAVLGVRNGLLKKISGKAEHVVSGFRALRSYTPPLITIKTPEGEMSGYTAVIGNARNYGGSFQVTPHASITEPLLDVCLFRGRTRKDFLRFVYGVIRSRHLTYEDVSYSKASDMEIRSEGKVHVQIDGEYFGTLPVKIDVIKDAMNVIW